ncbi:hypothetical protein PTQ19_10345 [Microbacterium esteraromaticum]|uniref:hypothetical protein n=1 Tax=Microbacterium esteraromaticum TaxID=57043 RepID=UPI002367F163|nr:hypothetical protein [Microbacterium esteraromaticum]WDH77921.1 hypothetical protein PTQ19_10345 [Microbacterium esteraromaticum]
MSAPERFRKKPVEIEAMWLGAYMDSQAIVNWIRANGGEASAYNTDGGTGPVALFIHTLEGQMRADIGDWIIRGVQGEFYPCKPDIFEQTYQRPSAATPAVKQTPLQRLDDAIHNFVEQTGGEGKTVSGWVLGTATSRIDFSDDDLLPLRSGETYAIGPQTAVVTAAGLARFLSVTIEHAMLDANDD